MKRENWIKLKSGINDTLKGKVVDTYAFHRGFCDNAEENSHLIIKFTDGTYICVGIVDQDDISGIDYILDNKYCSEITEYIPVPGHVDILGKFHLDKYIMERVQMGVIEPMSDEKIKEIINKEMEERRNERDKQYLKLKEEFGDVEK